MEKNLKNKQTNKKQGKNVQRKGTILKGQEEMK